MSRRPQCCPTCGRPLPTELAVTSPVRRRLVEIIANHPNGIARGELMNLLYADDEDGGPECAGVISVLVLMANRQLRPQGWLITSERGPGAKYRLKPIPAGAQANVASVARPTSPNATFCVVGEDIYLIKPEPLVLSKEQLAAVMTAANSVPACWKDRFLALVSDRLLGLPLTDTNIITVANDVRVALIAGMGDE